MNRRATLALDIGLKLVLVGLLLVAGEWPSLLQGPGAGVQVESVTEH